MTAAFPLLAALNEDERLLLNMTGHSAVSQMAIVFGTLGGVAVVCFLLVFAFRKRLLRRKRKRLHHHHHDESADISTPQTESPAAAEGPVKVRRRRRRRSRHAHRPLNPTLAETGGLPPIRDEDAPPPIP